MRDHGFAIHPRAARLLSLLTTRCTGCRLVLLAARPVTAASGSLEIMSGGRTRHRPSDGNRRRTRSVPGQATNRRRLQWTRGPSPTGPSTRRRTEATRRAPSAIMETPGGRPPRRAGRCRGARVHHRLVAEGPRPRSTADQPHRRVPGLGATRRAKIRAVIWAPDLHARAESRAGRRAEPSAWDIHRAARLASRPPQRAQNETFLPSRDKAARRGSLKGCVNK